MKVATMNIGGGIDLIGLDSIDSLVRLFHNFDVLLLQEVHGRSVRDNQASDIAQRLNLNYIYEPTDDSHLDDNLMIGLAILSKNQITGVKYYQFLNPKLINEDLGWISHDKGILVAKTDEKIVASTHLVPFHRFYQDMTARSWTAYRESVANVLISSGAEIIGADMNLEPAALSKGFPSFNRLFVDSLPRVPTRPKQRKTDYLFLKRGSEPVKEATVITTRSDHYFCGITI